MMDVLDLPEVTLCCIDTRTPDLALRAMKRSATQIRYGDVLLLTSVPPAGELPDGWRCELVRGINSAADYSHFVLKELYARIRTKFVLIVQWDGYVAQPVAWQDAFLACDYIGAVWPQFNDAHTVGNGGFSLRSTRLMALMAGDQFDAIHPEDLAIGRLYRDKLESEYGIVFAKPELADQFAFERNLPRHRVFGFHGLSNLPVVEHQYGELSRLLRVLPREVYKSVEARRLVKNLLAVGHIELAQWVLSQRRAEIKGSPSVADRRLQLRVVVARLRAQVSKREGVGVGRFSELPIISWLRQVNRRRLNARRRSKSNYGMVRIQGADGRWITAPTTWAWGQPDWDYLSDLAERHRKNAVVEPDEDSIDPMDLAVGRTDNKSPIISIVIAAYGNIAYTLRCIKSIQDHAPSCTYEVLVIEDASGQAGADKVNAVKGVRFIKNESNLGYLRSCNKAVKLAQGQYVYLLNNDAEVTDGALDSLLELLVRREDVGVAGSKLVYPDGCLQEAGGILWSNGWAINYGRFDDPSSYLYEHVREVDYISGASMMIRKSLWDKLDGYDEHYCPAYGEDSDLAMRIRQAGLKVLYQPRSLVIHHEGISHGTSESSGLKAYQRINRDKFGIRWGAELMRDQLHPSRGVLRARDRSARANIVLVIDHYVPEPDRDAGSKTMYQMVEMLVQQNFTVKFWPDNLNYKSEYVKPLQDMGVEVIYGSHAPLFSTWIKACGMDVDYVVVSRPTVARDYVHLLRKHSAARIVYYGHDLHFARMALQAKVQGASITDKDVDQMKELERSIWKAVDIVLYPSSDEIEIVGQLEPDVQAKVICPYAFPIQPAAQILDGRKNLLFVAGFQHPPNVDAALWLVKDILPLLRQTHPGLHLTLAGSNPSEEVKALACEYVTVTGSVSDERLSELYKAARVALIPLRFGAGIKLKVVEAMYKGVPLVTTSVGTQGLVAIDGVVQVADVAQSFADAVLTLLADDAEWLTRAQRQCDYVQQYFSPDAMARGLRDALNLPALV
jgi:GT2 family glycosyltransferase